MRSRSALADHSLARRALVHIVALATCLTSLTAFAAPEGARWRTGWVHQVAAANALAASEWATLPCATLTRQAASAVVIVDVAHLRAKRRMALALPPGMNVQPGDRVRVDVDHCALIGQP